MHSCQTIGFSRRREALDSSFLCGLQEVDLVGQPFRSRNFEDGDDGVDTVEGGDEGGVGSVIHGAYFCVI